MATDFDMPPAGGAMDNDADGSWKPAPKRPGVLVLFGGLTTSAVAMAAVSSVTFLTNGSFNLMGFYVMAIVPITAILVGALAGSGYSIVAYLRNAFVPNALLGVVVLLQIAAYFTANYAEYRIIDPRFVDTGERVGYLEYFDFETRSFTFSSTRNGGNEEPQALGAWGYGLRGLEILGFTLGGLIPLLVLRAQPYCEDCQSYMKTMQVADIPSSVPARKVKKKNVEEVEAYEREQQEAAEKGTEIVETIQKALDVDDPAARDMDTVEVTLAPYTGKSTDTKKLPTFFRLKLQQCPVCGEGTLSLFHAERDKENDISENLVTAWQLDMKQAVAMSVAAKGDEAFQHA